MKITKLISSALVGLPLGLTFWDNVASIARVDGVSMQPTLNPDVNQSDYVVLNHWALRSGRFKRGEVLSLINPTKPDQVIVKRLIGFPGEQYFRSFVGIEKVPLGHCWIEGDHIGCSSDSTLFGSVPFGLVTAKVVYVVWPPSRWQRVDTRITDGHQTCEGGTYYNGDVIQL